MPFASVRLRFSFKFLITVVLIQKSKMKKRTRLLSGLGDMSNLFGLSFDVLCAHAHNLSTPLHVPQAGNLMMRQLSSDAINYSLRFTNSTRRFPFVNDET